MKKHWIWIFAGMLLLCGCKAQKPGNASADAVAATQSAAAPIVSAAPVEDQTAFFAEVKSYILSAQEQYPWSANFLDALDWDVMYAAYANAGGDVSNETAFATYINDNAPAPTNWQALFEAALLNDYGQTVDHYEDLGDGMFEAYVVIDGSAVPYVTVNSRTGWYHG